MAELKTKQNNADVEDFINKVPDENKRKDGFKLLEIFKEITKEKPKMWGSSIIGFGSFHYKSEKSRQEGDWLMTGFSPRKANLSLYIIPGFDGYQDILKDLGKFKTSPGMGSCLYINKLEDVDMELLKKLIKKSYADMKKKYA